MKFMLLILDDKKSHADKKPADFKAIVKEHGKFGRELAKAGKLVHSERLRPEEDAAHVRSEGDEKVVVDGPFAETKEFFGGFYLIECDSKDEAVEWAKKLPVFESDTVEIRPVW